jgi:hypothetical protein
MEKKFQHGRSWPVTASCQCQLSTRGRHPFFLLLAVAFNVGHNATLNYSATQGLEPARTYGLIGLALLLGLFRRKKIFVRSPSSRPIRTGLRRNAPSAPFDRKSAKQSELTFCNYPRVR